METEDMSIYHYDPPPELYEVEASQWFKDGDHPAVKPIYGAGDRIDESCGHPSHEHGLLKTADGTLGVCPGHWIVTDSNGQHRRYGDIMFEKLFKPGPSPFRRGDPVQEPKP